MVEIFVQVAGDHWINADEVILKLQEYVSDEIIIDIGAEGPSINALGLTDILLYHCRKHQKPLDRIKLRAWSNPVETVPFPRVEQMSIRLSHFFWLSKNYWCDPILSDSSYRLAMFMGRRTFSRCRIMYDLLNRWPDQTLASCMESRHELVWDRRQGRNLEDWQDWIPDRNAFFHWWRHQKPASIDYHQVGDQYDPTCNTNRDLLKIYNKFDVEVVCETYTIGETFFPTEKTVRPIMAGKPFVVYGPRNYLQRLRGLGFKTWNEFWDEEYDTAQSTHRWHIMLRTLSSIVTMTDWHKLESKLTDIAKHNRECLEQLIKKYQPK